MKELADIIFVADKLVTIVGHPTLFSSCLDYFFYFMFMDLHCPFSSFSCLVMRARICL